MSTDVETTDASKGKKAVTKNGSPRAAKSRTMRALAGVTKHLSTLSEGERDTVLEAAKLMLNAEK